MYISVGLPFLFEKYISPLKGVSKQIFGDVLRLGHNIDLFLIDLKKEEYAFCKPISISFCFWKDDISIVVSLNFKEYIPHLRVALALIMNSVR